VIPVAPTTTGFIIIIIIIIIDITIAQQWTSVDVPANCSRAACAGVGLAVSVGLPSRSPLLQGSV